MKHTIINALFLSAAIACISCEDMLDYQPKDRLSPDTYFKTETDCELWTNNYYTVFPSAEGIYSEPYDVIVRDVLADEISGVRKPMPTDGNWNWEKLREMNFFLSRASQVEDESVRLEYEGLTRFFRAYFYFEKVKRYGDVPWVDRPLGSDEEELYKGRDSRESVMEKVMEDVDFAIANLPEVQNVYRVTRWTARALKSRIALFEGTFRKYHGLDGYEEFLQACVNASEPFLTGPYSIYTSGSTPYQDLFTSQNAIETEIILARAYTSAISGMTHDVNGHLTGATMGRPGMTRNVVNMYLMRDGSRYTDQENYAIKTFVEECKNRDLRMAQTLRTPGYKRIGGSKELAPDLSRSTTGYQLIKYLTEEKYDANKASTNDMPLFRLAEVLLNYAEAKAELGTLKQADLDNTIRPLRVRAGLPDLDMEEANANPDPYLSSPETGYANVTGDNKGVILEIRRERTLETPMEGLRYWDIVRWKEGKRFEKPIEGLYFPGTGEYDLDGNGSVDVCIYDTEKAPGNSADVLYLKLGSDIVLSEGTSGNVLAHSTQQRIWNEARDYLYPIPTDDRVLTQGAISQNPGWNDGLPF
ncbi:RagB/SusD family nutrient uptake outer membrane protein [Alistipes sp. An66]|uniref:RagB/SusD family nutrient uptake outer membrane protein n=1 Tax=Alistipes sp. An66 TaxID=1965650 RepID=UPI000B3A5BCD|nr:RagB/SusD family nutrient uptake outer membrane protein [Alistipes sp. An66]OUN60542.1 RagB/SusD family nutrient uptake outer membrane protein [Alistipes sp. An66]